MQGTADQAAQHRKRIGGRINGNSRIYIPLTCGLGGLVLGIAAMFIMPTFPGTDILTSAAIGIVSGLAATGVNQTIRQLTGR